MTKVKVAMLIKRYMIDADFSAGHSGALNTAQGQLGEGVNRHLPVYAGVSHALPVNQFGVACGLVSDIEFLRARNEEAFQHDSGNGGGAVACPLQLGRDVQRHLSLTVVALTAVGVAGVYD